jgi:hypothetical protein
VPNVAIVRLLCLLRSDPPNAADDRHEEFTQTHNAIASKILEDEEDLVDAHRRQIDETMKLVKEVCCDLHVCV